MLESSICPQILVAMKDNDITFLKYEVARGYDVNEQSYRCKLIDFAARLDGG